MGMNFFTHTYDSIITLENVLSAWQEFRSGKKQKKDVQEFERNLMDNILLLYTDLKNKTYRHGGYHAFTINDPKKRDIHKATVRDRVAHHLLYNELCHYFNKKFIHDSYSCQINKGTHNALQRFSIFTRKVSKNYTKPCFILKCDIRKFFASIDHNILKQILVKYITDRDILKLLENIIDSFQTKGRYQKGLPLGNLTSQLLVNIYMHEFDYFIKHHLKQKYYIRYADDFVFIDQSKNNLEKIIPIIQKFLTEKLQLEIHPQKLFITSIYSGIDFLGWIFFPKHIKLRTVTKRRMFKKLQNNNFAEKSLQSYLGLLFHGNTWKLQQVLKNNKINENP